MKFPSKDVVDYVKSKFPEGSRVKLVHMNDPYTKLPEGMQGTVRHVDDMATVHVDWDNGSGLGAVYGEDVIQRV